MANSEVESKFKTVVSALGTALKPRGFAKLGNKFRRGQPNIQLIEFQRSQSGDATLILFTLNIGVVSARALQNFDPEARIAKAGVLDAHLRERIGFLSDQQADRWYQIDIRTDEQAICSEIVEIVTHHALPWLEKYSSDDGLVNLWQSGRSPGLTEGQRKRYLAALA